MLVFFSAAQQDVEADEASRAQDSDADRVSRERLEIAWIGCQRSAFGFGEGNDQRVDS
jgi:hypothetical protein